MSDQVTVLVYSDDRTVREQVRLALGTRIAADIPPLTIVECATQPAVLKALDAGGIQLAIFDGEAGRACSRRTCWRWRAGRAGRSGRWPAWPATSKRPGAGRRAWLAIRG